MLRLNYAGEAHTHQDPQPLYPHMPRRLSLLGLELAVAERWAPAASRAHGSDHGLLSGLRAFSNGIEAQVRSAHDERNSSHPDLDCDTVTSSHIQIRCHSCHANKLLPL